MPPSELNTSEKYCVFRSANERFCVPASDVRNVGPRPSMYRLPMTDDVLAGLAHEQREFIPVYSFLIARGLTADPQLERQMLVMMSDSGPWGLLIDEVLGLESLELSLHSQRGQSGGWSSVTVGSTAFRDSFVTAIDAHTLVELIQGRLAESWTQARSFAQKQMNSDSTKSKPAAQAE